MGGTTQDEAARRTSYQAWRERWRWTVRTAFLAATVGLFIFAAGFFAFAEHISRMRTPAIAGTADGIVVLTGGQYRLAAAVELLKAHKGKRLLISGVNPNASISALPEVLGVDHALFDCCVDVDMAANTISNAEETAKWIAARGYRDIILVTNNYHMPRSLMEMRRFADGVVLHPYPVVNTDLGDGNWLKRPQAVRVLFLEYTKFLAAASRSILPVTAGAQANAKAAAIN